MPFVSDDRERDWRRRRFADIAAAQATEPGRVERVAEIITARRAAAPHAIEFLDRLERDGDLIAMRDAMGSWSKQPPYESFGGFGQMFVNQIANAASGTPSDVELIAASLRAPTDEDHAATKLRSMLEFVERVKKGAHPAPRRALYVCSFFWALQARDQWPCLWASAERMLTRMGWMSLGSVGMSTSFGPTVLT